MNFRIISLSAVVLSILIYSIYSYIQYNNLRDKYINQLALLQKYKNSVKHLHKILNKCERKNVDRNLKPSTFLTGITISDLKKYLTTKYAGKISNLNINRIITAIEESSIKYKIPEIIIFSILKNESDFRWWIEHNRVLVKIQSKKDPNKILRKYVRGVGMGGIIWEIWGDKLKKEGIAYTKSDLFVIKNNIQGVAYILSQLKKMKLLEHSTSPLDSAILRYYGNNGTRNYSDKIFNTISQILYQKLIQE